mmetsp:Transcript_3345/g.5772  ORF Transcript_3345/g.5772 Transcript_3345/m.5772 type:complete len:173 (-) Transcript_3345:2335-2853(-)
MQEATTSTDPTASARRARDAGNPAGRPPTEKSDLDRARFAALSSAIYHDICMKQFLTWHRALQFATVLLGSGAVAGLATQEPLIAMVAGLAVTAIGAAQLVWDFGVSAQRHQASRKAYFGLMAELGSGLPAEEAMARMATLYAEEPPVNDRVNGRAHDKAGQSLFGDDYTKA